MRLFLALLARRGSPHSCLARKVTAQQEHCTRDKEPPEFVLPNPSSPQFFTIMQFSFSRFSWNLEPNFRHLACGDFTRAAAQKGEIN